jgi:predicted dehydrogenase
MSTPFGRRTFLGRAAGTTLALTAASYTKVYGANERVHLGLIGSGGRGRNLVRTFLKDNHYDCEFNAVCDVYEPHVQLGLKEAGGKAKPHADHRALLDDKTIQAVVIATPDHWHKDQLLDSVRAGKDVYLEKPFARTIDEGAQMVEAVKKSQRIVQVGMQRRSSPIVQEVHQILERHELGDVALARAQWFWNMPKLAKDRQLKGKLDWPRFCGPAGDQSLHREGYQNVAFLNWRYFWAFSGGNCTDQGAHLMDVIQWCLSHDQPPRSAVCQGQVHRLKPAETPDVFVAVFEYPEFLATWTLDYSNSFHDGWRIVFQGDKGTLELDQHGYRVYPDGGRGKPMPPPVRDVKGGAETDPHVDNFLACLHSRHQPNATVEVGHAAVIGPHMANLALRGSKVFRDEHGKIKSA